MLKEVKEVRVGKNSVPVSVASSAMISLKEGKEVHMSALGLGGLVLFKAAAMLNEWLKDEYELEFTPCSVFITDRTNTVRNLLKMEIRIV